MKSRQTNALMAAVSCLTLTFTFTFTGTALAQGRPETPGKPETPATPEKPETPVVPDEKPETPAAPEKPETPVVPDKKPETPAAPDKPERPEDDDLEELDIEDPEIEDPEVEDPEVEIEDPEVEDPEVEKPEKPEKENMRPDFVNELKAARDSYNEQRKALRDALKADLAELGDAATKEQVEDAVSKFRQANADLIALQKAAAEEIKLAAKEEVRGNAPAHVVQMREDLRSIKDARKAARNTFKSALATAETHEAKKALIDAFRTEQRDQHKQLKAELKKLREETRNLANDGDRRLEE